MSLPLKNPGRPHGKGLHLAIKPLRVLYAHQAHRFHWRDAANGKPAGFKLCIGHPWEFLAICKAMFMTNVYPDFIVIDGKEGGTGAAPLEFVDQLGMPLRDGLTFARNRIPSSSSRLWDAA